MKKCLFLFLAAHLLTYAEEMPSSSPSGEVQACGRKAFYSNDSLLQIGGNYTYVWITPAGTSTFGGSLGGLKALYEYIPSNSIYGGLVFMWRQGSTSQASNTRSLLDFNVEERLGYTFGEEEDAWRITPFSGLGYRYLSQGLVQTGLTNLNFNYNEFYIPVGFLLNGEVYKWLSAGVNFTWMPQVYPAVTIVPLNGANWSLNCTLANVLVEIPITFSGACSNNWSFELTPFFEYWQDGQTNAVTNLGFALDIPQNTYYFCGVELNFGWSF